MWMWMFKDIVEIQDLYSKKDDVWKKIKTKNSNFFDLKDFIFYKHICKMYIMVDIKGNCKTTRFI